MPSNALQDHALRSYGRPSLLQTIYVRRGEIESFVPRRDREDEVLDLIDSAVGSEEIDVDVPRLRRPGEHRSVGKSGKGGIRTLEGVSHPLPA